MPYSKRCIRPTHKITCQYFGFESFFFQSHVSFPFPKKLHALVISNVFGYSYAFLDYFIALLYQGNFPVFLQA
jgi:hypothetical protein